MPEAHHTRRERPDVDTVRIVAISFGFLAFVAIGMGVLAAFYGHKVGTYHMPAPAPFPAPQLQTDPAADFDKVEAAQRAELEREGWSDEAHGLRRIRIERAMALIAARGVHAYDPVAAQSGAAARESPP